MARAGPERAIVWRWVVAVALVFAIAGLAVWVVVGPNTDDGATGSIPADERIEPQRPTRPLLNELPFLPDQLTLEPARPRMRFWLTPGPRGREVPQEVWVVV